MTESLGASRAGVNEPNGALARQMEMIAAILHQQAGGESTMDDDAYIALARQLFGNTERLVADPRWSPQAEQRAADELGDPTSSVQIQIDELRAELATLAARSRSSNATASGQPPPPSGEMLNWALRAIRISVSVFVGAVVAGPLCAVVPTTWLPIAAEPLKAAIGGAAGVLTAEVTGPIEARFQRRHGRAASANPDPNVEGEAAAGRDRAGLGTTALRRPVTPRQPPRRSPRPGGPSGRMSPGSGRGRSRE